MNLDAQTTETVKMLWVAVGVLIASNFGVFFKIFWDHRSKTIQEEKTAISDLRSSLDANTKALNQFDLHLQRVFTAVKILAGDKWSDISKVIQQEVPRNQ